MTIVLDDAAPYQHSVLWQIHDAYFAARGAAAWTTGDIPYRGTNNFAAASQHARLLEALVVELEAAGTLAPTDRVAVLEIGCGVGEFASNFLRALDESLAARVRYVLSDFTRAAVEGAAARPDLRRRVEAGQVVPALFDLRAPGQLTDLDGTPLQLPLAAVIANYVCCVTPLQVVRRDGTRLSEATCTVTGPVPLAELLAEPDRPGLLRSLVVTHDWRERPLDAIAPDGFHAGVLARVLAAHEGVSVRYPYRFFDFVRAVRERALPGAMVLVSDYGSADETTLKTAEFRGPDLFGNTVNHGVDFSLFEPFCAAAGCSLARTRSALRSIHVAAIRFGPMGAGFARAFTEHATSADGDAVVDLAASARRFATADPPDRRRAIRLLQQCLVLDPYAVALHHEVGELCIDAGLLDLAEDHLERCAELDEAGQYDVEFQLGRLHARAGRPHAALDHFRRSLDREEHPVTLANIGLAHLERGEFGDGYRALRRSLELEPDNERSKKLMDMLRLAWTEQLADE